MRKPLQRAFTLVETIVASTLLIVMVGLVLGMALFQTRMGITVDNYSEMNTESRKVLNVFENDMRLARTVGVALANSLSVNIIRSTSSAQEIIDGTAPTDTVEYNYDAKAKKLTRNGVVLLSDLDDCQFLYFNAVDAPSANVTALKKVLLAATMRKSVKQGSTGNATSDYLVSAIVTMRCRNNN